MTMPMTIQEKTESKVRILSECNKLHDRLMVARNCLRLSDRDDFSSEYIVIAKDMMLMISNESQGMEHMLHEILDAPIFDDKTGEFVQPEEEASK